MYIRSKTPVNKWHAIGYAVSGGMILFGLIVAFITYFSTGEVFHGMAVLIPFIPFPVSLLVFLGFTQETARNLPMAWKRALLYAFATGITLFGFSTSAMLYFMKGREMEGVLGALIPFIIPGLCLMAFLLLTEKKRHKSWVVEEKKMWLEYYSKQYGNPLHMEQRGMLSGALWILAIALFVTLGFVIGFKYSWVTFLFAVAGELLIEFWMRSKNSR